MENNVRLKRSKKIATSITIYCIIADVPLVAFLLFGPKEGMEALGIIVPWLFRLPV